MGDLGWVSVVFLNSREPSRLQVRGTGHPSRSSGSMLDTLQIFLRAGVVMKERKGGAEFFGCGVAVALLFEYLAQHVVSFEGGSLFDRGLQISTEQTNCHGEVSAGA